MNLRTEQRTVPLTAEQNTWLRANSLLPMLILLATLGGCGIVTACVVARFVAAPLLLALVLSAGALLAVVALLVVRHARQHYADLRLGVAYVAEAELAQKRATQQSPRTFTAELSGIGTLTVAYEVYEPLVVGQRYRVTYSPHIRRAWALEPIERR